MILFKDFKNLKITVTGGNGFVGRQVVKLLVAQGLTPPKYLSLKVKTLIFGNQRQRLKPSREKILYFISQHVWGVLALTKNVPPILFTITE